MRTPLLAVFTASLTLAVASAQQPATQKRVASAAGHTLPGLSPDVLFDAPRPGELWAVGHDWKACFDPRGLTFVPFLGSDAERNFPLRIELVAAQVAGRALTLTANAPQRDGDVVRTDRGALVERITTSLRQIEQDFVFATLPARGDVTVEVALHGELAAHADAAGVHFAGERGGVDYTQARALDAAGRSLDLPIEWDGQRARCTIPAGFVAAATLPLVLDPLVATHNNLAPGITPAQRLPDVATLQGPDRALVCWQRQFSATDQDTYAIVLDGSLANATAILPVDVTTQSWAEPRCASAGSTRTFLVAAQVDAQGSASWIAGRIVDDTGVVGSAFDIERAGVLGATGNNFHPDVGGDSGTAPNSFLVVFEKELVPGTRDIYCKQVSNVGVVATTLPIALQTNLQDQRFPSVSKTNHDDLWYITWQTTSLFPPFDHDIEAATVGWAGIIGAAAFTVSATPADETRPCASSPADVDHNGGIYVIYAWETAASAGADRNIAGSVYDSFSNHYPDFSLTALEAAGNAGFDQSFPEIDTDGTRFVIGYTETSPVQGHDTYASTIAYVTASNSVRVDDSHSQLGHAVVLDDLYTRIAAWTSGGNVWSPLYVIAGSYVGSNDTQVFDYGGYAPGAFFTTVNTHCGTLPITASGTPIGGDTVTITVPNIGLSGISFGYPGSLPLGLVLGPTCNCTLGAINGVLTGNPVAFAIPNSPQFVGITLAAQGYSAGGTSCLGILSLSDTVQFTIH